MSGSVKKSVNIWQSYEQERNGFVHFLRLLTECFGQACNVHETTTFRLVTVPNIHRFKKNFSLTTLTTSMSLVTDKRCCACAHVGTRSTSEVARWYTTCVAENSLFMATRSCLCRSTVADLRAEAGAARVAR